MGRRMREKLRTTIEEIPENKVGELLDFVEFLLEKARHTREPELDLDPEKDPILKYIGGVSHGSLAKNIDGELYGE
jgi:hypothetical protein